MLDLFLANTTLRGNIEVVRGTLVIARDTQADIDLQQTESAMNADDGAVLRAADESTFSGNITGPGRVEVDASGSTVRFTGTNDYEGATDVLAGTLVVDTTSLCGDSDPDDMIDPACGLTTISSGAILAFEQGSDGSFDGEIAGDGTFQKRGSGTLTLVVPHPGLTGTVSVQDGTLALAPPDPGVVTLPGDVIVQAGAILTGEGFLNDAVADSTTTVSGILAPTGSGIRLHNLVLESGSTATFVVSEGATTAPLTTIAAGSTVTLQDGASIDIDVEPGDYSAGQDALLITGAGTVMGNIVFEGGFEFLNITDVSANANELRVNVQGAIDRNALLAAADTSNQRSVADALADLIENAPPGSAAEDVTDALSTTPEGGAPAVYDAVGGESLSAFTSAHLATGQRFERGLHRRVRGLAWGSRDAFFGVGPSPDPNPPGPEDHASAPVLRLPSSLLGAPPMLIENTQPAASGLGVWSDAWGVIGSIDGDGNSNDTDLRLTGVSLAVDQRIANHGLVGISLGYTYADLDVNTGGMDAEAHGIQTALYGGWASPRGYISAAGRFAWASNESERDVRLGTQLTRTEASFDSLDYGVGVEVGLNLLRVGLVVVQPLASFDWTRVDRDSFNERANGALVPLALSVEDESIDSLRSSLGLRAQLRYPIDKNSEIVPELRARWYHEFGDEERVVRARLRGTPDTFQVKGAETGSDLFVAGIGWSVGLDDALRIHADYDAVVNSESLAHELGLTLRMRF